MGIYLLRSTLTSYFCEQRKPRDEAKNVQQALLTQIQLTRLLENNSQPVPLYEDVQPSLTSLAEDQGREFKLEENVACGPERSIKERQ